MVEGERGKSKGGMRRSTCKSWRSKCHGKGWE